MVIRSRLLFKVLQTPPSPGGRGPASPFLASGLSSRPSPLGGGSTRSLASGKIFG